MQNKWVTQLHFQKKNRLEKEMLYGFQIPNMNALKQVTPRISEAYETSAPI